MTYVFATAARLGDEPSAVLAERGVRDLLEHFQDPLHGGFFTSLAPGGDRLVTGGDRKRSYLHCFVLLAAASCSGLGIARADELLSVAAQVVLRQFWDESAGLLRESCDRGFTDFEPYLGANANMHAVESFMATAWATDDTAWTARATRIATALIDRRAREAAWLLPEHFTPVGELLPDFNRERPADEFRPYGVTIGHLIEWSRLVLELDSSVPGGLPWASDAATGLYRTARRLGWNVDGAEGFVYTVDWDGTPFVRQRPHWVVAEAIAAAATRLRLGDVEAGTDLDVWWQYAQRYLRDHEHGSWFHELGPDNRPASTMWSGKPDVYHALHAVLLPALQMGSCLAQRIVRQRSVPTW